MGSKGNVMRLKVGVKLFSFRKSSVMSAEGCGKPSNASSERDRRASDDHSSIPCSYLNSRHCSRARQGILGRIHTHQGKR